MWSVWLVSPDCGFHSVGPMMDKDKRFMEASSCKRLTEGETGSCSDGRGHAQYIFNPIFCWWVGLSSLLFGLRPKLSPTPETPGHSQAILVQFLVGTPYLFPGSWCSQGFVCALQESVSPVLWRFWIKSHWPPKSNSLGVLSPFVRFPGWEICCGS